MEADGSGGGATEGLAGRPAMRGRGGAVDEDPVRLPRLLDEAEWLDVEGAMPTIASGVVGSYGIGRCRDTDSRTAQAPSQALDVNRYD